jgi:hypothetical protein
MPAKATTRTSTKPASTPRAKAGAATDATIRKVVQQEQAKGSRQTTTKATSTRSTGNNRQTTRKGVAPFPFREVTVLTETYMEVQGLDGESFDLVSCPRCAALIPSTGKSGDKAEKAHRGFHDQIDGLDQRA